MSQASFAELGIVRVIRGRRGKSPFAGFYCAGSGRTSPKQSGQPVDCAECGRRVRTTSHHRVPNHVRRLAAPRPAAIAKAEGR